MQRSIIILKVVSVKHGLWTVDHGLGIKHGIGIKCALDYAGINCAYFVLGRVK